jgi:hypothetical protein
MRAYLRRGPVTGSPVPKDDRKLGSDTGPTMGKCSNADGDTRRDSSIHRGGEFSGRKSNRERDIVGRPSGR